MKIKIITHPFIGDFETFEAVDTSDIQQAVAQYDAELDKLGYSAYKDDEKGDVIVLPGLKGGIEENISNAVSSIFNLASDLTHTFYGQFLPQIEVPDYNSPDLEIKGGGGNYQVVGLRRNVMRPGAPVPLCYGKTIRFPELIDKPFQQTQLINDRVHSVMCLSENQQKINSVKAIDQQSSVKLPILKTTNSSPFNPSSDDDYLTSLYRERDWRFFWEYNKNKIFNLAISPDQDIFTYQNENDVEQSGIVDITNSLESQSQNNRIFLELRFQRPQPSDTIFFTIENPSYTDGQVHFEIQENSIRNKIPVSNNLIDNTVSLVDWHQGLSQGIVTIRLYVANKQIRVRVYPENSYNFGNKNYGSSANVRLFINKAYETKPIQKINKSAHYIETYVSENIVTSTRSPAIEVKSESILDNFNDPIIPPTASSQISDIFIDAAKRSGINVNNIDTDALSKLDAIWKTRGDEFNGIFDDNSTAWNALKLIANVGRTQLIRQQNNFITFTRDQYKLISTMSIDESNMLKDSFQLEASLTLNEEFDGFAVRYRNPQNWVEEQVLWPANSIKSKTVTLFGCTSEVLALDRAKYLWAVRQYRRYVISFSTEAEGYLMSLGDRIAVRYYDQNYDMIIQSIKPAGKHKFQIKTIPYDQRIYDATLDKDVDQSLFV